MKDRSAEPAGWLEQARNSKPATEEGVVTIIDPISDAMLLDKVWQERGIEIARAALLTPEAIQVAESAVHRKRGLSGSGEAAVRAALEAAGLAEPAE